MDKDKLKSGRKKRDLALKNISYGQDTPKGFFVLFIVLYFIDSFLVVNASRSSGTIAVFGLPVPLSAFVGIFSSIANICIIFLVVLYSKVGYFTSLGILAAQFPMLILTIVKIGNLTSIPGLFGNLVTIIAITIIYFKNNSINKYQQSIRRQAVTDNLTGLPNRFAIDELLSNLVKDTDKITVVSINLHNFKSINETMGRNAGDKVLIELATRWRKIADTWAAMTSDYIARIAGDEFLLIIAEYDSQSELDNTIAMYKSELERKMTIDDCDYYLTAYFGYSEFPEDTEDYKVMIAYADAAMQEAKRKDNTNSAVRFLPEHLDVKKNKEIEDKICTALDTNTVFFYLQPQYDMDKSLRGFEALARMRDSDGAFISPAEFIPIAENTGLIDKIDLRVFTLAVEFLEKLLEKGNNDLVISVNVSVRHLMKNDFLKDIKSIIESHNVPADHLEIEITESIMIDSAEKALQCIQEIKDMGIKIAIDDFGTGYSSLSYLNILPADILKIDKSFIDVMNDSESSKQYVSTIISIGHILNLKVISEGVESPDQIETLKANNCDFIQGFVWGRPLPPDEAEKLVV